MRILVLLLAVLTAMTGGTVVKAGESAGNRTVKAGIFHFDGYHMKDDAGSLSGYGIDFLNLAAEYSHLNFEYVEYDKSWNDMLTMLENGEIDIVTSGRKTEEWEEKYAFSLPIGRSSTILSIRADNGTLHSGDYDTYRGMKVGAVEGRSQKQSLEEFAEEHGFTYEIVEYSDTDELTEALQEGEVDAILSTSLRKTRNEKTLDTIELDYFYAIVRKEDTGLLEEINYAIGQMDINEGDWMNVLFYKYYGPVYLESGVFTEREKAYIQDVISGKKTITVTAIGDREPYSYVENGELKGIMPDYFAKVMALAGLPYETVVTQDRAGYYDLVDSGEVDVVIDRKGTDTVKEGAASRGFSTNTYMTAGVAQVTRQDFYGEISTVAVAENQDNAPIEKGLTGDAEILRCSDRKEALQAVLDGKADAAFVYTYTAQLFVNNDSTDSLHYAVINDVGFAFRMYVREECDRELVTILNKCIAQMPDDVMSQLVTKYTAHTSRDLKFWEYMKFHPEILITAGVTAVVAAAVMMALMVKARWSRKLLETTEKSNQELMEQFAIVDALSRDYVNVFAIDAERDRARVIKMMGYVTTGLKGDAKEEFTYKVILERYIRERVYEEDQAYLQEALSLGNVMKKLESGRDYQGNYRVREGEEIYNYQFTYMYVKESGFRKEGFVLAGFRNIDETIREEQVQKLMLAEALGEAQYANNAKTTFLNSMSHDIRTPMNAIIGFTSLAMSHIDNRELVQNYLEKIITSGNHLLSLINDVLDMSRIESGKMHLEEKSCSLPDILHSLRNIVQADVHAKQLELYIDTVDVIDEEIFCDKLRLNQVLLNLLSNCIKYTGAGGMISMRITERPGAPAGYANYEFVIRDTGVGMSEEFVSHIFEPFEREKSTLINGIQGTGLGMAITKNIVDMMSGTISVKSKEGVGTEFMVSFTFRLNPEIKEQRDIPQLKNCRALVVDDDFNTCDSVSYMFQQIGMRAEWTMSGKEAVLRTRQAVTRGDDYTVYIIDWMLPDMNGIEVTRRIRKEMGEDVAIIVLTAYDWADIEDEAREAGVSAFCSKPLFLSELRECLHSIVNAGDPDADSDESDLSKVCTGRILLAEDNELNQEIATALLGDAGFIIEIAENGQIAVDMLKNSEPGYYQVVLMDVQMPVMNGYEAVKQIRKLEDQELASIPVLAMTANAFEEDKQEALKCGMNGHIAKPIDIEKLFETLRKILK